MDLKHIRDYYGFSQHTLAQQLGISRSYLAQIEKGHRDLPFHIERQVMALFDVKAAEQDALERNDRMVKIIQQINSRRGAIK